MSPQALFIIGAIVFAVVVYGAVVAGGVLFTRRVIEESGVHKDVPRNEAGRVPLVVKY